VAPAMTTDIGGRGCDAYTSENVAVFWMVPRDANDRRELDRWCRAVGPIVFVPNASIDVADTGPADSVVLVVWNVSLGAGNLRAFLEREIDLRCGPVPRGEGHALLLLQEVFRQDESVPPDRSDSKSQHTLREREPIGERVDIERVASECGLSLLYIPSVRNGDHKNEDEREDIGNAILSTLPLRDPFAMELPREASRRVATGVVVDFPDGESLRALSLHFNTFPGPWKLLRTGNSSRVRQALALADALTLLEGQPGAEEIATVAGGDMNTWSVYEGAFRQLMMAFPDSPEWHGEPTRGSFPTDHLFFRKGPTPDGFSTPTSYHPVTVDYNSDHRPVIAWMLLGSR
jgi:endonuclease/exonuclease/phosphatase family metal-dependent hydrolase